MRALKGQCMLLAQGDALGMNAKVNSPCKGKSIKETISSGTTLYT